MDQGPFRYQVRKDGVVRIFRGGRCVTTVSGPRGRALASELNGADDEYVQYLLQRASGNYKRGNERREGDR